MPFIDMTETEEPIHCPECGDGELVHKNGKYGPFVGCTNYPECKYTAPIHGHEPDAHIGWARRRWDVDYEDVGSGIWDYWSCIADADDIF